MKQLTAATTLAAIALMGAILAPSARANEWTRKTEVTFSGPVEIPGVHLAGWGVRFTPAELPLEVAVPIKSALTPSERSTASAAKMPALRTTRSNLL